MYRANPAVFAAALTLVVAGTGGCAGEGPPSIPVGTIFDAQPMCGGDGRPDPEADAAGAPVTPDAGAPAELDAAVDAPVLPDAPAMDGPPAVDGPSAPGSGFGRPGRPGAKVVLISIDGLRPDAIFYAPAPNLIALACKGSYTWQARTIDPSITLPSHASMVSGFPPEKHMIYHNDLQTGYIAVPTVMSLAKQAGKRVVLVVGKEKMVQLIPPGTFDVFVFTPDLDQDVIGKAVEEVRAGFDLMFIHLPLVDLTGHAQGWMSKPYLNQVRATDEALGRLLAELPPETTVIITADHGGSGYNHLSGLPEDVHIPWIVKGPGVRAGHPVGSPVHTFDTAATVAHVLGLQLVPEAQGRPVTEPWD